MKKKYILIPLAIIVSLIAVVVTVAVILKTSFLEKLPYDHMDDNVYNGVEIIGDNGLFYLVKDDKKISKGYASLQSVNDYYKEDLSDLAKEGKNITLFEYYVARRSGNSPYLLVSSSGEELTILGENYSLDLENTKLPFLIFTNNANGLKAVICLDKLDSDLSYKSGNELTLRPFKSISTHSLSQDSILCDYICTEDISNDTVRSYFRRDGIKICSGSNVTILELYTKDDDTVSPFFYNAHTQNLLSVTGELIASDIRSIEREGHSDWKYVNCYKADTDTAYSVIFSPTRYFSISSVDYHTSTIQDFGNCIVAHNKDSNKLDVINILGRKTGTFTAVSYENGIFKAVKEDGTYSYLNENGVEITSGNYSDMTVVTELSSEFCTVFQSAEYDSAVGAPHLHFAREGSALYSLNVSELSVNLASTREGKTPLYSFIVTKTEGDKVLSASLSPFSIIKIGNFCDTLSLYSHNGIYWFLGTDYSKRVYEIIDPLTSRTISTFSCSEEDFAKYVFSHKDNIALATDPRDPDTATHMCVITLSKYDSDDIKNNTKYFVLYRSAEYASDSFKNAPLQIFELGSDLLIDSPYESFSAENFLITHTAFGSNVFSLDSDLELYTVATLPYKAIDVLVDRANSNIKYFVVETDAGMKGVFNTESEEILTPYYNKISCVENGNFVVNIRGAYGVIKAKTANNVKTIVDFLYSKIIALGDEGYYAITGEGMSLVYSGKHTALSDSIQSYKEIRSYSTDEDGTLNESKWYLFSADGKLYLHRSEQKTYISFGNYECNAPSYENLNQRAKVIYYYNGSTLLHTDVIYPNQDIVLRSEDGINEWFMSFQTIEQTQPITPAQLYDKYIIKLYAKSN